MFSRTSADTVAVVNVKNTPGVKVTSGNGETDKDGNLVVPLNSYNWNTVTVDAGTLPLDTELGNTSQKMGIVNLFYRWEVARSWGLLLKQSIHMCLLTS